MQVRAFEVTKHQVGRPEIGKLQDRVRQVGARQVGPVKADLRHRRVVHVQARRLQTDENALRALRFRLQLAGGGRNVDRRVVYPGAGVECRGDQADRGQGRQRVSVMTQVHWQFLPDVGVGMQTAGTL